MFDLNRGYHDEHYVQVDVEQFLCNLADMHNIKPFVLHDRVDQLEHHFQ